MTKKGNLPAKRKISEAAKRKFMLLADEIATEPVDIVDRSAGQGPLGTARWSIPQYDPSMQFEPGRLWLGQDPATGAPLGYGDDRHIFMVAGSRCGKGTSFIVNNLITWPGSLVCVDPKGENATVTARRRGPGSEYCHGMGQKVCVLDPMNATTGVDDLKGAFNPLDAIDPCSDDAVDDAGRIADAIVVTGQSKEPFWEEAARELLKGLILHVLTADQFEGSRNLITVRTLLMRGDTETFDLLHAAFLAEGQSDEEARENATSPYELLFKGMEKNLSYGGVISGIGTEYLAMMAADNQFAGIKKTLGNQTEFLDSPGMRRCVETSTFQLSELKTDPSGLSLYLSLPQRYMKTHFRWLRMMVSLTTSQMEKTPGQPVTGHRVLMVLDEFAGLKKMDEIEDAAAQIAGFGVKLMPIVQNIGQLKRTYKENWQSFIGNAGTRIFFGIDDHETQKFLSDYIGNAEVVRTTETSGHSLSQTETRGKNASSARGSSETLTEGLSEGETWSVTDGETQSTSDSTTSGSSTNQSTSYSSGSSANRGMSKTGLVGPVTVNQGTGVNQGRSTSSGTSTSHSTTYGTSHSTSHSETRGGSKTTSRSAAKGTSETLTEGENESTARALSQNFGTNETVQKTALITSDEIGIRFARIDDEFHEDFPGLALVMVSGRRPYAVRRANYHNTPGFAGLFDPHPDHPAPPLLNDLEDQTNSN